MNAHQRRLARRQLVREVRAALPNVHPRARLEIESHRGRVRVFAALPNVPRVVLADMTRDALRTIYALAAARRRPALAGLKVNGRRVWPLPVYHQPPWTGGRR